MKKVLACCIFIGLVSVGGVPVACGAPVLGAECKYNNSVLVDKQRKQIRCNEATKFNSGLMYARDCYVFCDDGELKYGTTGCQAAYYKIGQYSVAQDLYEKCGTEQEVCDKSGRPARWSDTLKKCTCGGDRYEWNGDTLRCEDSADYTACVTPGSGARWVGEKEYGYCACNDINYRWTGSDCSLLPKIEDCRQMADGSLGNGALTDKVKWDGHSCICIKDSDGNVISNPDEYYITNTFVCEKLPSVQYRENVAKNAPVANAKIDAIKRTISELNDISDKFGRSHWKNADGGFNTARLASDSVAGVVLGTVGGVITSNVIKKNQVKNGFEDINCVIGGQRVAGYADQFNVGIQ